MWTLEELEFILYNNRSVTGVVSNFIPKDINLLDIIRIEKILDNVKSNYSKGKDILIDKKNLNLDASDIKITPDDLNSLLPLIENNIGNFNDAEYKYLINRGLNDKAISDLKLVGLSNIKDSRHLKIIGATIHPLLKGFLSDGVENGGIIIPLILDNRLLNCCIRKISTGIDFLSDKIEGINNYQTLKYSLACPDISIWGLDDIIEDSDIWICEGIFDMYALKCMGKKSVSSSSAMWSSLQLKMIIDKKPKHIYIFSDNDITGLRSAAQLRDFFKSVNIDVTTAISNCAKDGAEHFFEKKKDFNEIIEIDINSNLLELDSTCLDIVDYLSNRKF